MIFDKLADTYDSDFTRTLVGRLQRGRIHHFLEKQLHAGQSVLELNCGTGEDALWLAPRVKKLLVTDHSARMLKIAEAKFVTKDVRNAASCLLDLRSPLLASPERFQLVFSDFAGINCLNKEEVKALGEWLSAQLSPGGKLAVVLLSRRCAWENLYFLLKGDLRFGRRRGNDGVLTDLGAGRFKTYYYSPKEFRTLMSPHFSLLHQRPVGLFIPPSFLNNWLSKHTILQSVLRGAEWVFGAMPGLADFADHYYMVLQKNGAPPK